MRITAIYRIRCAPGDVARKAEALAVEQSVEMPVGAIDSRFVMDEIVGRVGEIADCGDGSFRVAVSLSAETVGGEAGQLMNMLFGNSSLHEDVTLEDTELPPGLLDSFGGPGSGIAGLRDRAEAPARALTCAAIKPQGLPAAGLAELTYRFALGGIDFVKDDHGLADQDYSPFAERVAACAAAARKAAEATGRLTRYAPSLSGNLEQLRAQVSVARGEGLDTLLIAPMVVGIPAFHAIAAENRDMAFLAHPAMGGAARIAPPLLIGTLFRLFGADAVIFPNHGGRFGYSPATCASLAEAARTPWGPLAPAIPVPAGGMTLDRLGEMLTFYGADTMVLIGGGLLAAKDRLTEETQAFVRQAAALSEDL
ncbi:MULTISPECIES: RuBisCO large subunit C-terminal-like domain-containing protein [Rhodomicrobium]|uniref:RuBisCO large subunit C-terminal-like domain-containing protein n=1 Tax=Rhodomicrobium TaxID=1068 RepID=UPI000B4B6AAB|nr:MULTISPECIES: RuBisCO large subunit C-terminal-like domain-containing protein [Rhodomicrobium]